MKPILDVMNFLQLFLKADFIVLNIILIQNRISKYKYQEKRRVKNSISLIFILLSLLIFVASLCGFADSRAIQFFSQSTTHVYKNQAENDTRMRFWWTNQFFKFFFIFPFLCSYEFDFKIFSSYFQQKHVCILLRNAGNLHI